MGIARRLTGPEVAPNLGFNDMLGGALRALWFHRKAVGIVWLVWTALLAGYYFFLNPEILGLINEFAGTNVFTARDPRVFAVAIARAPYAALKSVFIVLLLRTFLTGSLGRPGPPRANLVQAILTLFVFEVLLTALVGTPIRISDNATYASQGRIAGRMLIIAYFATLLFQMWLISRLCLVYSNAALGHGWRLRESWRATSGYGLRLTGMLAAVCIPMQFGGESLGDWIISLSIVQPHLQVTNSVVSVMGSALLVLRLTVVTALGAVVFARLTHFPASGVPGGERTPAQLAETFE